MGNTEKTELTERHTERADRDNRNSSTEKTELRGGHTSENRQGYREGSTEKQSSETEVQREQTRHAENSQR